MSIVSQLKRQSDDLFISRYTVKYIETKCTVLPYHESKEYHFKYVFNKFASLYKNIWIFLNIIIYIELELA